MKIGVIGLGYVGCVSAACLARDGNEVIGADINQLKVDLIRGGRSPIIEADIDGIISSVIADGKLAATTRTGEAVDKTDVSFVCVGTPSQPNGNLDLVYIERVAREIGEALSKKRTRHIVVIRSTILPGTMRSRVIPLVEKHSGKRSPADFGVCFNPEFLREGTSVHDYYHPPKIVVGSDEPEDANAVMAIYAGIDAPRFVTDLETAETVKYVDNAFHAVKICFANEIGNLCKEIGIDSHAVMNIFCSDRKLNLSSYYLKPGYAFGGSCLPKDLRALTYHARHLEIATPLLESIAGSNEYQFKRGLQLVMEQGKKKVGILGFSFKAGTDDLRESPIVMLIETLLGKGYKLKVYDRNVNVAKLFGANKEYIETHIAHISNLMAQSIEELVDFADVIVIGNKAEEFKGVLKGIREDQVVVDLVRIEDDIRTDDRYKGLCW